MKRLFAVVLVICLTATMLGGCGGQTAKKEAERPVFATQTPYEDTFLQEYVLCGESGNLRLYFQPSTTHFRVENTEDNSVWYSNPQNAEDDSYASKLTQMQMMSTLVVDYTNVESKKTTSLNLYTASVRSGKYDISIVENGVCFRYEVSEIGQSIYLAVALKDDYLECDVWYESIDGGKENIYVSAISVAPYFVSGELGCDGYLFLPDGSGALVTFDTALSTADSYSRPIYGEEPTGITRDYYLQASQQAVRLPVLGVAKNGSAMMAVVTSGAELGTVKANACGQLSSYANAYISYGFLSSIEYDLGKYNTLIFDKSNVGFDTVTSRYYFLSGEDANYSGMARKYRDYLIDEYSLEENVASDTFYTDIYAGVIKRVSTLGIPHDKFISLTNADQLQEMIDWLCENGVENITARYRSWNMDELKGERVDSAKADSELSFDKLSKISGAEIYPAVLKLQTYSTGGFFDALLNATYSITGLPFSMKGYLKSNLQETDTTTYWIATEKLGGKAEGMLEDIQKSSTDRLALGDIGSNLYSDFRDDGYRRTDSKNTMLSVLKSASNRFNSVMLDAANDYAAVFADVIYNTPVEHSNQDILGQSVPFYSMAISGIADCVAPSFNGEYANDELLLYTAASGTSLCYTFINEEISAVLTTELNYLTNVNFMSTREEALKLYEKMLPLYKAVEGSRLYSHSYLTDTLVEAVYENGTRVYVNFGQNSAEASGITVEGKSFAVKKGDK